MHGHGVTPPEPGAPEASDPALPTGDPAPADAAQPAGFNPRPPAAGPVRPREVAGLVLLLALALLVRLRGLSWGLPELNEEAVPLRRALDFWGATSGYLDLNPRYFFYPALTFYLHFLAQAATALVGVPLGWWSGLNGFREALAGDLPRFILLARGVTVVVAASALVPAWWLARRLAGPGAAFGAGLLMALTPLGVDASRYIVTDIPLMAMVAWALLALDRLGERGTPGDYARAGVAVGLASACKYTGLLLLVPLVVLHFRPSASGPRGAALLGRALSRALLAFALTSPWILLDLPEAIRTQLYQQQHQAFGHFGGSGELAAAAYLQRHIPAGFGIPLALAALAAVVTALRSGGAARNLALTLALFAGVLGVSRVDVNRYLLPLLPAVAVLVPWAAVRWAGSLRFPAAPALAALLLLAPAVPGVWRSGERAVDHDATRRHAVEWLLAAAPAKSLVAAESYSVEAAADSLPLLVIPFDAVEPNLYAAAYSLPFYAPFDFVVLSSAQYDRYRTDPKRYPAQLAFYEGVTRELEAAAVFEAGPRLSGPTIRIFRRRPGAARSDFRSIAPEFYDRIAAPLPMAQFLNSLGATLNRAGRGDLALAATEQALILNPRDPRILLNLGALRARRGEFLPALRFYEKALELDPGNAALHYNIGYLHYQKDSCPEALKYYLAAQRLNPRLADSYIAMAICQVRLNYLGPARLTLTRFVESFPGHPRRPQAEAMLKELESAP